jgi:hypothetical protein
MLIVPMNLMSRFFCVTVIHSNGLSGMFFELCHITIFGCWGTKNVSMIIYGLQAIEDSILFSCVWTPKLLYTYIGWCALCIFFFAVVNQCTLHIVNNLLLHTKHFLSSFVEEWNVLSRPHFHTFFLLLFQTICWYHNKDSKQTTIWHTSFNGLRSSIHLQL